MRVALRIGWLVFLVALLLRVIIRGPQGAWTPWWPLGLGAMAGALAFVLSRRKPDPPVRITRETSNQR
jgi:hypothetical protein